MRSDALARSDEAEPLLSRLIRQENLEEAERESSRTSLTSLDEVPPRRSIHVVASEPHLRVEEGERIAAEAPGHIRPAPAESLHKPTYPPAYLAALNMLPQGLSAFLILGFVIFQILHVHPCKWRFKTRHLLCLALLMLGTLTFMIGAFAAQRSQGPSSMSYRHQPTATTVPPSPSPFPSPSPSPNAPSLAERTSIREDPKPKEDKKPTAQEGQGDGKPPTRRQTSPQWVLLTLLLVGRCINGIAGGNMVTSRHLFTVTTSVEHRTFYFNLQTAAGWLGMALGPVVTSSMYTCRLKIGPMIFGRFVLPQLLLLIMLLVGFCVVWGCMRESDVYGEQPREQFIKQLAQQPSLLPERRGVDDLAVVSPRPSSKSRSRLVAPKSPCDRRWLWLTCLLITASNEAHRSGWDAGIAIVEELRFDVAVPDVGYRFALVLVIVPIVQTLFFLCGGPSVLPDHYSILTCATCHFLCTVVYLPPLWRLLGVYEWHDSFQLLFWSGSIASMSFLSIVDVTNDAVPTKVEVPNDALFTRDNANFAMLNVKYSLGGWLGPWLYPYMIAKQGT
ncbi:unnamed protein product [Vitrella brassicaformis CCMP3155]|uniref:Uncharacterized protein n=2 Tax=Vitrella brassicaformis TaxID=1169539 RepID=A0A0G4E8S7_VITBC|nr:unnamed protein product [Vitrella brassicaformis CCMP3155]|eukprot:CEL91804.1 unnamed protein product [Vitrella brassicaformis CCMP3155]